MSSVFDKLPAVMKKFDQDNEAQSRRTIEAALKTITTQDIEQRLVLRASDGDRATVGVDLDGNHTSKGMVDAVVISPVHSLRRVGIPTAGTITLFGDSFTTGSGASAAAKCYANVLADRLGLVLVNRGVGGSGVHRAIKDAFANITLPRRADLLTWMTGFNDFRRGGANSKTRLKVEHCLRAFLAHAIAISPRAASVLTLGGVTSPFSTGALKALALGGTAIALSSTGTITFTSVGDSAIIGYVVSDGVNYTLGSFTVTVDGTLVQTVNTNFGTDFISDGVDDNGRVPGALFLTGLGSGSHTIVITGTSATNVVIDYIATARPPETAEAVVVAVPARMSTAGYAAGGAGLTSATDIIMARGADSVIAVVEEFLAWPVALVYINNRYILSTDVNADTIHPNDLGHKHIAQALAEKITVGRRPDAIDGWFKAAVAANAPAAAMGRNQGNFVVSQYGLITAMWGASVQVQTAGLIFYQVLINGVVNGGVDVQKVAGLYLRNTAPTPIPVVPGDVISVQVATTAGMLPAPEDVQAGFEIVWS